MSNKYVVPFFRVCFTLSWKASKPAPDIHVCFREAKNWTIPSIAHECTNMRGSPHTDIAKRASLQRFMHHRHSMCLVACMIPTSHVTPDQDHALARKIRPTSARNALDDMISTYKPKEAASCRNHFVSATLRKLKTNRIILVLLHFIPWIYFTLWRKNKRNPQLSPRCVQKTKRKFRVDPSSNREKRIQTEILRKTEKYNWRHDVFP